MKRTIYIFILLIPLFFSCTRERVIPKNTFAKILYDFYFHDGCINGSNLRTSTDSLLIYEPILNKYGYTTADYNKTVSYYLHNPERYVKIYMKTQKMLQDRRDLLDLIIKKEYEKSLKWGLLDSLERLASDTITGNDYFRAVRTILFKPDSTLSNSPIKDTTGKKWRNSNIMLYDNLSSPSENYIFTKNKLQISKKEKVKATEIPDLEPDSKPILKPKIKSERKPNLELKKESRE